MQNELGEAYYYIKENLTKINTVHTNHCRITLAMIFKLSSTREIYKNGFKLVTHNIYVWSRQVVS